MSVESDLVSALNPLVGNRVHFGVLPVDTVTADVWPCIVLPTGIITPDNTICGASDLEIYRVQIDLYARSYGALVALRGQVFESIDVAFPLAERINSLTDYEADLKLHRRIIEYSIPAE